MFGVLFESRARRQRRNGGAALSVAAHIAVIGAVTVATAAGRPAPLEKPKVVVISLSPRSHPTPPVDRRRVVVTSATTVSTLSPVPILHIPAPVDMPAALPAIDVAHGPLSDSIVIGPATGGAHSGQRGIFDGMVEGDPSGGEWSGTELLMRIVSSVKPRYPEMLRQAGVEGRVLVRFTVDTLGRVDMNSVQILQSTHDQFTQAVRNALATFRFRPSEVRGKRVAALAEMPFEFSLGR